MGQPLVTRPAYGDNVAEAKLPGGGPAKKGLPMDDRLKSEETYVKPEEDIRPDDKGEDASIYRKESPDSLLKNPDELGVRDDNADAEVGFNGLGPSDGTEKTKYPYRDDIPNRHSSEFVAALWTLSSAPERPVEFDQDLKIATRMVDILTGLNPKVIQRAQSCSVNLKRADLANLRWIFAVDCGNGVKAVKVKAARKGKMVKLALMDIHMTCSCQAWRWLGSEHHATQEDYIDGRPRGTASPPVVKDPLMHNRVCKHVAAVMGLVKKWEIPLKKG